MKPTEIINLSEYFFDSYIEMCGLPQKATFKECTEKLMWGTYDPGDGKTRDNKKLTDLTSDHLLNILITELRASYLIKQAIKHILKERHNIGDN